MINNYGLSDIVIKDGMFFADDCSIGTRRYAFDGWLAFIEPHRWTRSRINCFMIKSRPRSAIEYNGALTSH